MENLTLEEKIVKFVHVIDVYDSGSGSGIGSNSGSGSNSGYGYGYGYGYGIGSVSDSGSNSGSGYGSGSGSDSGYGSGSGYGIGSGSDSGSDSGIGIGFDSGCEIKSIVINQQLYNSYIIDNIDTFVRHIDLERGILLGFILNLDNTIIECVVVKENNKFAHGKDLREAIESLQEKLYDDSTETERIAKFKEHFQNFYQKYPNSELFVWHHILTGSCKFGRNEFVKSHNINLDGSMNIYEFIELTKSSYGENTIKKLLL